MVLAPVHPGTRAASLADLTARIESVERRWSGGTSTSVVTGLPAPLDRLACGVLHEWLCPGELADGSWSGPLLLFSHLAKRRMMIPDCPSGLILWIGRRVWPQPWLLRMDQSPDLTGAPGGGSSRMGSRHDLLLRHSVLIDPPANADRLWAIDLALRSPGVSVVAADGSGLRHAHSRRLQLAAESGASLALLVRPVRERTVPSAAMTRWVVNPAPGRLDAPTWRVEQVRCKGLRRRTGMEAEESLVLEHDHASGGVRASAELVGRPCDEADHRARRTA